jgi:hypothetical protein
MHSILMNAQYISAQPLPMLMPGLNKVYIPLKKLEFLGIWNSADGFYVYLPEDGITASRKRTQTPTYFNCLPFRFAWEMEPVRNVYVLQLSYSILSWIYSLRARHANSCSSLAKVHSQWWLKNYVLYLRICSIN